MNSFRLFAGILFLSLGCSTNEHPKQSEIANPELRSFDWKMNESGVEIKLVFAKKLALDTLKAYYGLALIDSRTGKSYEGDYYDDILFSKHTDHLNVFLPKRYFSTANGNDSLYTNLLRDKAHLSVRLFHIGASPLNGKLTLRCDQKQPIPQENYFEYRVIPDTNQLKQNSNMHYSIRNMNDPGCTLIYKSQQ